MEYRGLGVFVWKLMWGWKLSFTQKFKICKLGSSSVGWVKSRVGYGVTHPFFSEDDIRQVLFIQLDF